jgi:hypothetical protein
VIAAVESVLPIWDASKLDGRKSAARGCVRRSPATRAVLERRRLWPLEFHLIRHHTAHGKSPARPCRRATHSRARCNVRGDNDEIAAELAGSLANLLRWAAGAHLWDLGYPGIGFTELANKPAGLDDVD